MTLVRCVGCGAAFPDVAGPTHRYMESCPGCWAAYGDVLAREYADPLYRAAHRLTVDAYAMQHPGRPSPQSTQSVAVHLIRLHLTLKKGFTEDRAARAAVRAAEAGGAFVWLEPPPTRGPVTVADVHGAAGAEAHVAAVRDWAASAWTAWSAHHEQVRSWSRAVSG